MSVQIWKIIRFYLQFCSIFDLWSKPKVENEAETENENLKKLTFISRAQKNKLRAAISNKDTPLWMAYFMQ